MIIFYFIDLYVKWNSKLVCVIKVILIIFKIIFRNKWNWIWLQYIKFKTIFNVSLNFKLVRWEVNLILSHEMFKLIYYFYLVIKIIICQYIASKIFWIQCKLYDKRMIRFKSTYYIFYIERKDLYCDIFVLHFISHFIAFLFWNFLI